MSFLKQIKQVLKNGGPGYVQFAITNLCNARCGFCNFALDKFDPKNGVNVTLQQAKDSIDIFAKNDLTFLLFVGGEPMLHPDLYDMIRYAKSKDMVPMLCTNASFLTPANIDKLADAGLSSCVISIDAATEKEHEDNRGLHNVCAKIKEANQSFKKHKIQTTASITMSRLIKDYSAIPPFVEGLGFHSITFSYPLQTLGSSYLGFSDSGLVSYTSDELVALFDKVKELKSKFHIVNPMASLEDMQRFVKKQTQLFPCLGGLKYFYLDWNLNMYRCHHWATPMCHINDFNSTKLIRDGCTACMIDCYRDSSVLQYNAIAISDSLQYAKRGHLIKSAKTIFDKRTFKSLKSVFQDLSWISHL